jgi:hypothetical protein
MTAGEDTFVCDNCGKEFPNSTSTKMRQVEVLTMPGSPKTERVFHSLGCLQKWNKRGGRPRRRGWLLRPWRD